MAIEDEMKDVQQLVVNQLGVANGLNNSLADGQVTPAKLSAGAPTWYSDGDILISGKRIEINYDLVGDNEAYVDFHSTSASNPDYDARIHKATGENSIFKLVNKGSGDTRIIQDEKVKYQATSASSSLLSNSFSDSRISCFDSSSSFLPSGIQYSANTHSFKNVAQDENVSIQMNMTDDGNAELVVGSSNASSGDGVQLFKTGEIYQNKTGTQSAELNKFYRDNTQVGSITTNGSTTSFNTSSDYRLKTDAQPMVDASARVQALNPVNFEWISSGERVDGFLAHEAQEVVPESVHGTKDALDEEGNPEYQGIDQSKLVPLLTAALQEALTKIEALEARITALEA
jgi:hypothetical protein